MVVVVLDVEVVVAPFASVVVEVVEVEVVEVEVVEVEVVEVEVVEVAFAFGGREIVVFVSENSG